MRERLKAGDTATRRWLISWSRAKREVRPALKPRVSWHTAILWGAPLTILIAGLFGIGFSVLRRSSGSPLPEVAELSEGERLKLNAIERSQPDSAQVGGGLIP